MEVLPQIRELFERLPARRTQHNASGRIGENNASLRIGNEHAFGEIIQYDLEALSRRLGLGTGRLLSNQELGTFSLGPLALAHVLASYEDYRTTIRVPYDTNVFPNPQYAPVFVRFAGFPTADSFRNPQARTEVPRYTLSVLFVEDVEHRTPDQLLGRIAELSGSEAVDREHRAFLV